ncbi:hypothetical protein [Streptomyces sp. SAS_276]|uniref:hypothetical protein n=1 Tax=Streptomyces sp. SAS_276 TaxID=3412745 RepID=UPI00403C56F7
MPGRTVAIAALWDGDTDGWFVELVAVMGMPPAEHRLATIRHGSDMGLFNGAVSPWPEAQEAETVGRALAVKANSATTAPGPSGPVGR